MKKKKKCRCELLNAGIHKCIHSCCSSGKRPVDAPTVFKQNANGGASGANSENDFLSKSENLDYKHK